MCILIKAFHHVALTILHTLKCDFIICDLSSFCEPSSNFGVYCYRQALLRTKHLRENGGYIPKQVCILLCNKSCNVCMSLC